MSTGKIHPHMVKLQMNPSDGTACGGETALTEGRDS